MAEVVLLLKQYCPMDYLAFIDAPKSDSSYERVVERQINSELENTAALEELHPEVIRLLRQNPIPDSRFDSDLYELYRSTENEQNEKKNGKRSHDEDILTEQHIRKSPRIQMCRYDIYDERSSVERLAIIDNYLHHQLLVLQDPLRKTMLNQWAINNDFMSNSSEVLQRDIVEQEKQIQRLNEYRKGIQYQYKPEFEKNAVRWKEKLINNLNVQ